MFTSSFSLNAELNSIKDSAGSRKSKIDAVVKLGLPYTEALALVSSWPVQATGTRADSFVTTFGVEIETVHCPASSFVAAAAAFGLDVMDHTHSYWGCHADVPRYKIVPDSSICGASPAECVTPALKSTNAGFKSLEACCKALSQVGATVNRSCGLHVHIGAADLTEEQYVNVFENYRRLETAIDSFMALSRKGDNSRWCRTIRSFNFNSCRTRRAVDRMMGDRYFKVNPESWTRHQTIEFRQHAGTTNFTKIKNWVKFLVKLVGWSRTHRLDRDINCIEDIPFLTASEKRYFAGRRDALTSAA